MAIFKRDSVYWYEFTFAGLAPIFAMGALRASVPPGSSSRRAWCRFLGLLHCGGNTGACDPDRNGLTLTQRITWFATSPGFERRRSVFVRDFNFGITARRKRR